MKKPVSPVTGDATHAPHNETSLAARVLAEGLGSVSGVVHGALGALTETTGKRAKPSTTDGRSSR